MRRSIPDLHLEDTRQPQDAPEIRCPECDEVMQPTWHTVRGHPVYHCLACDHICAPGEDDRY